MNATLLKSIMPVLSPMLNKFTDALKSLDEAYKVEDAMLLIRRTVTPEGKEQAVMCYMHVKDNKMSPILDQKTGKPMTFGMDQIVNLISGSSEEDLEEED